MIKFLLREPREIQLSHPCDTFSVDRVLRLASAPSVLIRLASSRETFYGIRNLSEGDRRPVGFVQSLNPTDLFDGTQWPQKSDQNACLVMANQPAFKIWEGKSQTGSQQETKPKTNPEKPHQMLSGAGSCGGKHSFLLADPFPWLQDELKFLSVPHPAFLIDC